MTDLLRGGVDDLSPWQDDGRWRWEAELIRRAIPRSKTYDMIWNLHTSVVLFGSTSAGVGDEFTEFFLQCFGLPLKAVFPYSIASRVLESEGKDPALLEGLAPSSLEVG